MQEGRHVTKTNIDHKPHQRCTHIRIDNSYCVGVRSSVEQQTTYEISL